MNQSFWKAKINFLHQLKMFGRAFQFAIPFKKLIVFIAVFTLLITAINVLEPVVLGKIIDALGSDDIKKEVIKGIAFLMTLGFVREILGYFNNKLSWKTRIGLHEKLLSDTIDKIYNFPLNQHRKEGVGATMNRLEKGINGFVGTVSELAFNLLPSPGLPCNGTFCHVSA